jgi:ATP-dependent DNA helicase DinG
MSILEKFPYETPRQGQVEVLQFLEQNWDKHDVFVIVAPTAFGKTALSKTIMEWKYGTSYIAPSNMLVDQFLGEFPDTPRLHRLDAYWCDDWRQSCAQTRARQGSFCRGCTCSGDLAQAKYRRGSGVYNYHTYLAHRLFRPVLLVDEAHQLVHTIQDRVSEKIWHHDYRYPFTGGHDNLLRWVESLPPKKRQHKKIQHLEEALRAEAPQYVVSHSRDSFNGKGTERGKPEERDCLKLYPVDISDDAKMFWPQEVEKIILMSATIGPKDIEELGLAQRRVVYLQAASPIPAENRPVQFVPVTALSHTNLVSSVPLLATEIDNIAAYHANEKGVVHVTYQLAELLRQQLSGSRYIFHTRDDKAEQYERFRESPAKDGRVLIACGMYEGIDLPDDLGRWQVIAKTPFKSLGDPAIKYRAEKDPDWYNWATLINIIQAAGRISRTPTDFGITYYIDKTTIDLIERARHLIPQWFQDAVTAGGYKWR